MKKCKSCYKYVPVGKDWGLCSPRERENLGDINREELTELASKNPDIEDWYVGEYYNSCEEWEKKEKKIKTTFPMQPFQVDEHGVLRFAKNRIVRAILDKLEPHGFNLNTISMGVQRGVFSNDEYAQLMQLIGYSCSVFIGLEMVPKDVKEVAEKLYNKWEEKQNATQS